MATSRVSTRKVIPAARNYARELWSRREFAVHMAFGNLKARNASTALGVTWWVLNPLLLGGIYGLVFGIILDVRRGTDNYIAYLLAGIFVFYYTRAAMVGGVNSIIQNTRLIMNLRFPRLVLPVSALIESAIGFLASLAVYYAIVGPVDGVVPGADIWWLVPAFVIHTVFNLGLAAIVARVAVPFRDVNNLVPYLLRLWLYLSPIIWPVTFLDNASSSLLRTIVKQNPMFFILAIYRHALTGAPMTAGDVIGASLWAVGLLIAGISLFVSHEGKMAKYL